MKLRMNHQTVNPAGFQTMMKLETDVRKMGIDPILYHLIKIRASQMNGCSFCLDMHINESRKLGETEQRLDLIVVWRESPVFSEKERAVLTLTEAVTLISEAGVPQNVYNNVRLYFSEKEMVALIMSIIAINSWNRLAITTGMFPGCFDNHV